MASAPASARLDPQVLAIVREFSARHYDESGARQFGMAPADLAEILAEVVCQWGNVASEIAVCNFLATLRLEELVLARACAAGDNRAWEVFLNRYRATLYESAYKIAKEESAARGLADSLYAALYGVDSKGQQRTSKLRSYQGRGSLQGWLRTVVAQEYINLYRATRRETSLDAALDEGIQFEASEPDLSAADPRAEAVAAEELSALPAEERFLLAAYYLDRRTLAEIAKLQGVHESTISRKLERVTSGLRKRIRKRMIEAGMSPRQADEAMQDVDVRDLRVRVSETLRQGTEDLSFYKEKSGNQG
ncbi:MAG TPA: sigma-70 family RNA polymerase sigma factor [Terriglobales bacterium]|jgi:RNA polymerase sigma-70 factor (ECF subfamily)